MDGVTDPESIYRSFIDRLDERDLVGAAQFVDLRREPPRELRRVHTRRRWLVGGQGVARDRVERHPPDLHVILQHVATAGDVVLAHGLAGGTSLGRLYGAPATKRRYEASFFDSVRIDGGVIVERTQQADTIGQMRQLYGKALGAVGVSSLLWRLR